MREDLPEDVLSFWFPADLGCEPSALVKQAEWWFRGGADSQIMEEYPGLLTRAERGELDHWSDVPRSRLALIIVLDQFSRSVYRDTAKAFANDPKALSLAVAGLEAGHYGQLETPWEKLFFGLPFGHSEELEHLDKAVALAEDLVQKAEPNLVLALEFSARQARSHRDVVARFGRHPHRNEVLGRQSTPDELEYLATSELPHTRPIRR